MSAQGLFAGIDEQLLARVSAAVGSAFAVSGRRALMPFAHDDSISPATFAAGLAQAHLLGAAAALAGAIGAGALTITDPETLAKDAASVMTEALTRMTRGS